VKYLDMPLQHASRKVLAAMKRGSSGDAFLKLLERVRRTIPGISLRTSFIVGFPGETEADFRELCDFVRAAEFDWMGVFTYSDVDTAESHALGKKVAEAAKQARRDKLMAMQRKISARELRKKVGTRPLALLEGTSKETDLLWEARLEGMAPDIDGKIYVTDVDVAGGPLPQAGDFVRVEITEAQDYDLVGRIIEVLPAKPRTESARIDSHGPRAALPSPAQRISTGAPLRILA
jgi:ribosomal protein S12 methylthiotransferase